MKEEMLTDMKEMSSLETILVTHLLLMNKKEWICVWQNIQDTQQNAVNYVKHSDHILDI
jgi:hypothetical protein